MTETRSGYAEVDGGRRLYFEVAGSGPPVVLIHPGLWDSRVWDAQMEPFAERHKVVRYDLVGYGRSERFDRPFSFRQDHAALLEHLGLSRTSIVGCSVGGGIAIDIAIERPEIVDALVLVGSGLGGYQWGGDEELELKLAASEALLKAGELERAVDVGLDVWTPLRTHPDVDTRVREIALDNKEVDLLDWSLSEQLSPPAVERLSEVRAPTLVLVGDHEVPDIYRIADLLATGIPGARKELIDGADHVPMMRNPEQFNRVVLEFLAETGH